LKKRPEVGLLEDLPDDFAEMQNRLFQLLNLFLNQIVIHFLADFLLPGMRDGEYGILKSTIV
jgi:hypothetical protein